MCRTTRHLSLCGVGGEAARRLTGVPAPLGAHCDIKAELCPDTLLLSGEAAKRLAGEAPLIEAHCDIKGNDIKADLGLDTLCFSGEAARRLAGEAPLADAHCDIKGCDIKAELGLDMLCLGARTGPDCEGQAHNESTWDAVCAGVSARLDGDKPPNTPSAGEDGSPKREGRGVSARIGEDGSPHREGSGVSAPAAPGIRDRGVPTDFRPSRTLPPARGL